VFDPMPRVGLAVGSNEAQLQCHPMVQKGRCKHPALHLRYHLQVQLRDVIRWSMKGGASIPLCTSGTISIQLNMALGRLAQYTVPAAVIQAVCIATPGSARINVACRLYSADELY